MDQQLILERYRPLEILGEGGHGTVVLAFDTRMARRVAIKSIPLPERRGTVGLEEARTAALLNHPAIVTVHEWDADEDEAFIIMEFLDGASLTDVLDRFGPLSPDAAVAILKPVAKALTFAHENGVLHLDVKPENVLVLRDGRVKLTDFGVASLLTTEGYGHGAGGTLGFMPLEQLHGNAVDERADEWAYAALAFETLADANPFAADTPEEAAFRIEYGDVSVPSEFEPSLDPAVDDILLAALSTDPDGRYASVTDMADALTANLGDPAEGRAELVDMVHDLVGPRDERAQPVLGLWDRLAPYSDRYRRVGAAVVTGWLAFGGLSPFDLGTAALVGAVALAATAALAAPAAGLALGLGAFAVGLGALNPLAGVVFAIVAGTWWLLIGRRGFFDGYAPATAPAAGVLPVGLTPPLLLGFVYGPVRAAAAAGLSALALMAASASTGGAAPFLDVAPEFFLDPLGGSLEGVVGGTGDMVGPAIAMLAWAAAGSLMAAFSVRGTRAAAGLGTLAGLGVMLGGYALWGLASGADPFATGDVLNHMAGSLILMVVVIAAGPPTHGAE